MTPEYADASEQSTETSNSIFRHPTSPFERKKTFADRWNRSRALSVQKRVCYPISHGESTNQDSEFVDLVDFC